VKHAVQRGIPGTNSAFAPPPQGVKRVMDVGGPSALNTTLKTPQKARKNKSDKNLRSESSSR
jgi:hypothetical protein